MFNSINITINNTLRYALQMPFIYLLFKLYLMFYGTSAIKASIESGCIDKNIDKKTMNKRVHDN